MNVRRSMKADLKKRLFKAIDDKSWVGVNQVARTMIAEERRKGHHALADRLEGLLTSKRDVGDVANEPPQIGRRSLSKLPTNTRQQQPLVAVVEKERLRHHMVLAPEVEDRFTQIEKEFAARNRLSRYGLRPRKKILLYGPPGCGKTLGAERLAWTTGLPLMKVRLDTIISSYFGESAAKLRKVFETSSERPTLLLLDECDFLARSREKSNDIGEVTRIVNALLQLLEDYEAPGLLVAATNIQESLDRALFRRFDDAFLVPMPGPAEIEALFDHTLASLRISPELELNVAISALQGYSCAGVVKVLQTAAKKCVLEDSTVVKLEHFESARDEVEVV